MGAPFAAGAVHEIFTPLPSIFVIGAYICEGSEFICMVKLSE